MRIDRRLLFALLALTPASGVQALSQACANLSVASFSSESIPVGQTSFAPGAFTPGDVLSISVGGVLDTDSFWDLVDGGGNVLAGPYPLLQLTYPITAPVNGIGIKSVGGFTINIVSATCAAATPVTLIDFGVR